MDSRQFLVLTPAADGADGISELTRQTIGALARAAGPSRVTVWSLAGEAPSDERCRGVGFWTAAGSRLRIVRRALTRAAARTDNLVVVVLHVHLAPLAQLLRRRGAHVVLFLIGIEVWTRLRPRERTAVAAADCLLSISAFTIDGFRKANPDLAALPVAVCAPGIGPAPTALDRSDSLPEAGFALIVGRLSSRERYKGHDALIAMWPGVLAKVPAARLMIAGDGDDRARLEAMAASHGVADSVSFLGRVDDAALSALYDRAAFFVMPSAREGFGLVYLEAMRAGKPCVACHGSADEIIRHGVDGFVVEPGAAADLAHAIVTMFRDQPLRVRMGAAARRRLQDAFTESAFADRLLNAIAPAADELVHP